MAFSNSSEKLMKHFVDKFDIFCHKKKSTMQKKTDKIFKVIYNDIRSSDLYVKTITKRAFLNNNLYPINKKSDIPKTHLLTSKYIPENIKTYIEQKASGYFKLSTWINGSIKLNIYFLLFEQSDFNRLKKIEKQIQEAVKIIRFCTLYLKKNNIDTLNVFLYLSKIQKYMPKSQIKTLGPEHCNSAVTYACQDKGELLVFREEEWKKVLIHELFHSMCLDFSGLDYNYLRKQIKEIYDVKSEFEISESYSEFWATIINCCFVSYNLLDDKCNLEGFLLYSEFCICFEKIFSIFQCVKMLQHMGLTYENIIKQDDVNSSFRSILFKEKSNILAYYIIKCVMIYFSDDFLNWCHTNNPNILNFDKTPINLARFGIFIERFYKKKGFLDSIEKMERIFYDKRGPYTKINNTFIVRTSRMTICELK